jgi:S1-C subfamily serine protease
MKKILTTSLYGLICFWAGVITQYVLPVASFNPEVDCQEIPVSPPSPVPKLSESIILNPQEQTIKDYAEKITVKVLSGKNSGSGVLIHRQGNVYQVVTNDHVLLFGRPDKSYKIQTPDGKIYPAQVANQFKFQKYDLGVLQFSSDSVYTIASLSITSSSTIGEKVYAAGFPYQSYQSADQEFTFTSGTVKLISKLSFRGGYQIGYTNDIKKGMSGGPLLNEKGQLIGFNGRHKYPAWGNPYIFDNGTIASLAQKAEMSQYSWAIPLQVLLKFTPELINKKFVFLEEN